MKQALALKVMLSGDNVLLTGPAGSGKTFMLNQFIKQSRKLGKVVAVTATTGIAATHLGGTTIHSWSGIGVSDYLATNFFERLPKSRQDIINKTDILIIDEISMLHDFRLDMIDQVCRRVRKKLDKPFGGLQIIMSGDFFQLPPVNRQGSRAGGFVVDSNVWRDMKPVVCYLHEQHRQDDTALLDILSSIRSGTINQSHLDSLSYRGEVFPDDDENITELHTLNIDVDEINSRRLDQVEGDELSYLQLAHGSKSHIDSLRRSVLAPETLKLKEGALVMAVKNSPLKKYVNGSLGVVVGFEPYTSYPIVKFKNGNELTVQPDTWELIDGEKSLASITQVPLRLAWAITVHKAQGMTLDGAIIDLSKAFTEGMGYVALSRVKSLDKLYLRGFNRRALMVSRVSQAIDRSFKDLAA